MPAKQEIRTDEKERVYLFTVINPNIEFRRFETALYTLEDVNRRANSLELVDKEFHAYDCESVTALEGSLAKLTKLSKKAIIITTFWGDLEKVRVDLAEIRAKHPDIQFVNFTSWNPEVLGSGAIGQIMFDKISLDRIFTAIARGEYLEYQSYPTEPYGHTSQVLVKRDMLNGEGYL